MSSRFSTTLFGEFVQVIEVDQQTPRDFVPGETAVVHLALQPTLVRPSIAGLDLDLGQLDEAAGHLRTVSLEWAKTPASVMSSSTPNQPFSWSANSGEGTT